MFLAIAANAAVTVAKSADTDSMGAKARRSIVLRDRFQGALLGLTLAPAAAAIHRDRDIGQYTAQMTSEVAQHFQQWAPLQTFLHQPVSRRSSTNLESPSSERPKSESSVGLASVPILLRLHNQPSQTRHQYLQNWLTADAAAIAQQRVLSDVLARSLQGSLSRRGWERWVSTARRTLDQKGQHLALCDYHYQGVWNAILEDTPIFQIALTTAERLYHRDIIMGVSKAIEYGSRIGSSADSALVDRSLAGRSSVGSASNGISLTYTLGLSQVFQSIIAPDGLVCWRVPLIVGLVLGAMQGRSGLPVLWQRSSNLPRSHSYSKRNSANQNQTENCPKNHLLNPAEALALADALFAQWSGCIA